MQRLRPRKFVKEQSWIQQLNNNCENKFSFGDQEELKIMYPGHNHKNANNLFDQNP